MPVKIRLQRRGKKHQAFFHIVIADGRAPRDGKFIEKIGTYNPRTTPATIDLDFDKALSWLQKGADPSDTVKTLLSHKGVMYKNHLLKGVAKKALTLEQVEGKFAKWLAEKETKISGTKETADASKQEYYKKRVAAEAEAKEKRAAKIAAKLVPPPTEEPVAVAEEPVAAEEVKTEEAPTTEATTEETPPQA